MAESAARPGGGSTADESVAGSAIHRYEARLARDPTSLAFAPLANLYRKAGRTRDAIALCRDGLRRYPHYVTARLILAKAYVTEGDQESALAELTLVTTERPDDAEVHRLLADLYRRRGAFDRAAEHLDRVAALDPSDREAARLRDLLRRDGGAEDGFLSKVLEDDTFITVSFGCACLDQGLVLEAATVFLRLLKRDPENPRARELLEQALTIRGPRRRGAGGRDEDGAPR